MTMLRRATARGRRARAAGAGGLAGLLLVGTLVGGGGAAMADRPSAEPDTQAAPAYSEGYTHPTAVRLVSQLTGAKGLTGTLDTWRIGGTDLGLMWDNGDGEILFAVGDTFGAWSGDGGGGGDWRSNALLRSDNSDFRETGMTFSSAATTPEGKAKEIIPSLKVPGVEHTSIPTGGVAVDGRQYLAFMSVNRWGGPGEWFTNYSRIAYSDDNGQTWNTTDGPQWDNTAEWDDKFQMVAFAKGDDGYVYMYGTQNGRFGPVHVSRVPEGSILDKAAYTYWDGTTWGDDVTAAAELAPAPVTELSVQYNDYIGKWMMMYTTDSAEEGIFDLVFRTADKPEGPWSDVTVVGTSADLPGLYAPYLHPWNDGPEVHFSLSIWGPYNVFQFAFTLDEDGNLIYPNLIEDPHLARSVQARHPKWVCTGPCGVDTSPAWAYGGAFQAWMRSNAGRLGLAQTVAVEPNTDYLFTAFVNTDSAPRGNPFTGEVGVRPEGPGDAIATTALTEEPGYRRYQVAFNSGDRESVEVFVGASPQGDRWVQTSGLSLVQTGPSGPRTAAVPVPTLVAATECGVEASVEVPQGVAGVAYDSVRTGTTVTVTATATSGYVLAGGAQTTWAFDVAAAPCVTQEPETPTTDPASPSTTEPVAPATTAGGGTSPTPLANQPTTQAGKPAGGLAATGAGVAGAAAVGALLVAGGLWARRRAAGHQA